MAEAFDPTFLPAGCQYPRMTARPEEGPLTEDWDLIPGARGCTPEACSFRDHPRRPVWYPVFPPDRHAAEVLEWLWEHSAP